MYTPSVYVSVKVLEDLISVPLGSQIVSMKDNEACTSILAGSTPDHYWDANTVAVFGEWDYSPDVRHIRHTVARISV